MVKRNVIQAIQYIWNLLMSNVDFQSVTCANVFLNFHPFDLMQHLFFKTINKQIQIFCSNDEWGVYRKQKRVFLAVSKTIVAF